MIRDWHGAARYVYNQCIEYLDKGNENDWVYIKANMQELFDGRDTQRALLNEFCKFTQIHLIKMYRRGSRCLTI